MKKVFCSQFKWFRKFEADMFTGDFVVDRCINPKNIADMFDEKRCWQTWIKSHKELNANNDCGMFELKWHLKLFRKLGLYAD